MLDHMVNNCLFSCHGNMSQLLLQLVVAPLYGTAHLVQPSGFLSYVFQ